MSLKLEAIIKPLIGNVHTKVIEDLMYFKNSGYKIADYDILECSQGIRTVKLKLRLTSECGSVVDYICFGLDYDRY